MPATTTTTTTTTGTGTGTETEATIELITRFENGFNTRDIDALMSDLTDDVVFEHVGPAESGFGRHEGQDAVRAVWVSLEESFPGYEIELVDIFANGNRCMCRWEMKWKPADGGEGFARGVDVFTVRDGKIAEKLSYVTM